MAARKGLIGGGAVLTAILVAPYFNVDLPNPFRTQGVNNIEARYAKAGGSPNAPPAVAQKRGDPDELEKTTDQSKRARRMGTDYFEDRYADQKAQPGRIGQTWNEAHHGTKSGK